MNKQEKETYSVCIAFLIISFLAIVLLNSSDGVITGFVVLEDIQIKSDFKYTEPENLTRNDAFNALLEAESDLEEMLSFDLPTNFIRDTLLTAKRSFIGDDFSYLITDIEGEEDELRKSYLESLYDLAKNTPAYELRPLSYSEVLKSTQLISFKKKQSYQIIDTFPLIEEKLIEYEEQEIDVLDALELLDEAEISFNEERYDESEAYLKEADIRLDKASLERKRLTNLLKLSTGFFERYLWQIIIIIVFLALITPFIVKGVKKNLLERKIETLKLELKTINDLIKKNQVDYLKKKSITKDTFDIKAGEYRTRMLEIKQTIPVLEALISGKKEEKNKIKEKRGVLKIK